MVAAPLTERPSHRLVHLSDLHLTAGRTLLHGGVDCDAHLVSAVERVAELGLSIDAVIASGDLADDGEPASYERLRGLLDEMASRLGVPVLCGMGNHDRRGPFRTHLLGLEGDEPVDLVHHVGGLRIIQLDSSVPGAGHGEVGPAQYEWLDEVLATPAPDGSVLVVHHPPAVAGSELMRRYDLRDRSRLAGTLVGSDVRLICSGHWHHSATSMLGAIPVTVAGALSYAADPTDTHGHRGMTGGQAFSLIELFDDHVQATVVPLHRYPTLIQV